jgi:hypothetical protein
MRRVWIIPVAAASLAGLGWPGAATASCIAQTPQQQLQSAEVVFVGVALDGPTETGVQRFRAERYVKGSGPEVVSVATGVIARSDGTGSVTSVSVQAAAGERWRIYGTKGTSGATLETSVCAGSTKLAAGAGKGAADSDPRLPSSATADTPLAERGAVRLGLFVLILGAISVALFAMRFRRRASDRPPVSSA